MMLTTEQLRFKKAKKSTFWLSVLLICISIIFVRSSIIDTVHSESQLDTLHTRDLTIKQLNEHIDLVSFKLEIAEKSIDRLKEDLIILKKAFDVKKNRRNFTPIDSLSIIRGTEGEIIKIGN